MNISVLVPVYNHSLYVEKCLVSICDAYSGNIELIVCDDYSVDDSYDVADRTLRKLKEKNGKRLNYKLLKNDANQGVCLTLNRCVSEITSEYSYLIASDDFLVDNSLDYAVEEIKKNKYDALISDCHVIDMDGKILFHSSFFDYRKAFKNGLKSKYIHDELVMNWTVPGPALLLKSSVYGTIGNYQVGLNAEDRDFYLRLISKCNVGFSEHKIACYRIHGDNISSKPVYLKGIENEMTQVNFKYKDNFHGISRLYLKSYGYDLRYGRNLLSRIYRKSLYSFFQMKLIFLKKIKMI
ncbi:glycosyltransferase family A protein [Pectobacterium peruviense]|uniref:glycosyltransferase family A protein n=1 Tax=Pectobacterium peruviense TaxID=2066479 RepID=UPI000DE4D8E7|nr:glycosyltransferase family A protein [Pectobacterium peruviense]